MLKGIILYEGKSQLDGESIVCIATGFDTRSQNKKTGDMVQTWIIRSDISPEDAARTGADSSICGDCKLRGIISKLPNGEQINRHRGCYVFVGQAPQAVWNSYRQGDYAGPQDQDKHFRGRMVRFGSYGDPCAVPAAIWCRIASDAAGWTGYTHKWREELFHDYRRFLMASVDSEQEAAEAKQLGWRWFRLAPKDTLPLAGEFHCPASAEEGYRLTCDQCRACDGAGDNAGRASVTIWPHGPPSAIHGYARAFQGESGDVQHRKNLSATDVRLLDELRTNGVGSAAQLAQMIGRGTQATASRMWHLRQLGYVRRIGRGLYEIASKQP